MSSLLRRSAVISRAASAVTRGGTPPLPPFARIPAPTQKLTENNDILFDDGVAPELALDFDCAHISSGEALAMWAGAFGGLALFYQLVKASDPEGQNPAVNRQMNMVEAPVKTGTAFFDPVTK